LACGLLYNCHAQADGEEGYSSTYYPDGGSAFDPCFAETFCSLVFVVGGVYAVKKVAQGGVALSRVIATIHRERAFAKALERQSFSKSDYALNVHNRVPAKTPELPTSPHPSALSTAASEENAIAEVSRTDKLLEVLGVVSKDGGSFLRGFDLNAVLSVPDQLRAQYTPAQQLKLDGVKKSCGYLTYLNLLNGKLDKNPKTAACGLALSNFEGDMASNHVATQDQAQVASLKDKPELPFVNTPAGLSNNPLRAPAGSGETL